MAGEIYWSTGDLATFSVGLNGSATIGYITVDAGTGPSYAIAFNGSAPFPGASFKSIIGYDGGRVTYTLNGTPSGSARTVNFSVKITRPDATFETHGFVLVISGVATPPVTVSVTAYTAPAMTVGTQYQYTVGKVVQPSATASQAIWTLDQTQIAAYNQLPSGTLMTSAGKLTIRPVNTNDMNVPVAITVPHPTAGQPPLKYTGLFQITDITAATPTPSVMATLNSFPQATVGVAYTRTVGTITAPSSGGTWSFADRDTLPSGATLSSAGVLATTFTAAGTFTALVKASATGYLQAIYQIQITVAAAPVPGEIAYSLLPLPNANPGMAYSQALGSVTMPATGATWSIASRGTLPSGAALSSAGVLTATFPTAQNYSFTAKISANGYADKSIPIIVLCKALTPITIQRASSTPIVVGQNTAGIALFSVTSSIGAAAAFLLSTRGTLPDALNIQQNGEDCELTGIAPSAGTFDFKVKTSGFECLTREDAFQITVTTPPQTPIIKVIWADLPKAIEATAYSQSLGTVTAPSSGATWTLTDRGNLPSGASVSSAGQLSIPSPATGIYRFSVTITASGYADLVHALSVTVSDNDIVLQKKPLNPCLRTVVFSQPIATVSTPASGATFALSQRKNLPMTIDLSQDGTLMGSFGEYAVLGPYLFNAEVSANGYTTREDEYLVNLVSAMTVQVAWANFPPAAAGVAYSQSLGTATQPASGATWTLSSQGDLPLTATLSSAGVLSTTLTTAKLYRFSVTVAATGYTSLVQAIELPCGENTKTVRVNQPTYANATVNVAYTASLGTVVDPVSGATWALTDRGTLPVGATVSSAGQLSATFTAVGSYQGTVTVSAAGYVSTTLTVKITVVASGGTGTIAVTMASLPAATANHLYAKLVGTVTTPSSGATWSISDLGTLSAGTYVAPDGILSCTPLAPGTFTGTVRISANGYTPITRSVTLVVEPDAGPPQVEVFQSGGYAHPVVNEPYATIVGILTHPSTGATWELTNLGTLPANATLTGAQFVATFPSVGSFSGEATVSAPGYTSLVLPLRFTVDANSNPPMTVTMNSLPAATTGVAYSRSVGNITVPSSGGMWSLENRGTLPSNATLSSAGVLAATFTTTGTFTGTARASASGYASTMATLTVMAATPAPAVLTYEWFDGLVYVEYVEARNVFAMIMRPKSSGRFTLANRGTLPADTLISSETLTEFALLTSDYTGSSHTIYHGTVGVITGTFAPGTYQGTIRIDAPGYPSVERALTVTAGPQSGTEIIVSTISGALPALIHQPSALYVGHVVYPPRPVLIWTLTDRGTLPDDAVLASDGLDGGLLTFTPTQLGLIRATAEVSTPGFTSASIAIEILVVSADDPPVIVDPPDPPDPPVIIPPGGGGGGGGGGNGGGGGGGGGGKPPPPPPPPVIDDLGASWVVRHTAHDDGQGGLAPTLNSLGMVDYGAGHLYFPPTFNYVVKRWSVPNAGGTGAWVYQEIPDEFGNGSEVTVSYIPDGVEPEEVTAYLPPPQLEVDLTPFNADAVIPGSVKFTIGSAVFQDYEGVIVMNPDANGIGTEAGTINYQTGKVVLTTWQAGDKTFALQALATVSGRYTDTAMRFRVAAAPLRPSGFTVAATALDGELLSGTADLLGVITGNAIAGTIDTEYGLCNLLFGEYVLDSGLTAEQKAEEWYDVGDVLQNGTIWQPRKVFPSSVRYNAVAYTSIPVSADIIGLDPVRLPSDGRVPIFVKGQLALVHQTSSLIENTLSPTQVLDTGEERLYRVALTDALGQLIGADQYVLDRAAGTVTMNANWSSAPYTAPFTLRYTIADLRIISAVDLSGKVTFNRALTHDYAKDDARLSGVLYIGTLQARVTNVFTQAAWTSVWQDTVIGTPPLARYNDVQYPIEVSNRNAYPDRFLIKFTSSTAFQIIGENLGVLGTGDITQDCTPMNTLTGYPYFTIPYQGWGVGWATGNCVRFNVVGACYPVDCARAIQPSEPSSLPDGATLLLIGNVDA